MRMHRLQFFVVLLLLFAVSSAQAQPRPNIEARLAMLNQRLEYARALVASFNDSRAQLILKKAFAQRDRALAAIGSRRWQEALSLLQLARTLAEEAIKLTLQGPAARFETRLEELIRRAEGIVIGSGQPQAERLLQKAKENQRLALKLLQSRNVDRAIEHYQLSQRLARQAIRLVEWQNKRPPGAMEMAREQFQRLRDRAYEAVMKSDDPEANRLYQKALKQGESAQRSLTRGQMGLAAERFNQAIRLFNRVLEVTTGIAGGSRARLDGELQRLDELIVSARDRLQKGGGVRARIFLDRAQVLRREAEQAVRDGDVRRARWKITVARNLVVRSLRVVERSPEGGGERLRSELQRLRSDSRSIRREAEAQGSEEAVELVNMAEKAANQAEGYLRRSRPRLSLEAVLWGNRFLFAAERLLRREDVKRASEEELRRRLSQLSEAITATEQRLSAAGDDWRLGLLDQAKKARDRAQQAIQKDQRIVARVNLSIGFEAIRKIARTFDGG